MRFFERRQQSESTLSVILLSDHVELSISLRSADQKPHVVFASSKKIEKTTAGKPLLIRLNDTLTALCDEARTEGLTHIISRRVAHGHFDAIRVFYGSPWYVSRGRQISITRSVKTPLTETSLKEIIDQNTDGLLPSEMKDVVILEEHAHGFTVNGYPIENPIGMAGEEVGMRVFVSAVDAATKNTVETALHRAFHSRSLTHHSTVLPIVNALRVSGATEDAYLLIDVSALTTEVSRIERDVVLDTASFPEGFETLAHKAAKTMKRRVEELHTIQKRPNDFGLTEEFKIAHDDVLGNWTTAFAGAFETLQGTGMPITNAILIVDAPTADAFKREIGRITNARVQLLSAKSYESLYDAAARADATTLGGLLVLWKSV
ncbi:MAG: hypothetical protein KBD16_03930 [Candidatus Pacebacteria bacterium]|nr:hypothetical protein [Candidatus Paceibacterota bacterium]